MYAILPILNIIITLFTISYNLGIRINMVMIGSCIIGVIICIIGNYLPTVAQNKVVGIKTKYTLSDDKIWNKTNRLAGFLWVITGIIIIIFSLVCKTGMILMFVHGLSIIPLVIIPLIYAYKLHNK